MAQLGNHDPLTVFNGDPKNERDILTHAIGYLYKKQSRDYVARIFATGMNSTERKYAESIMESSGLFDFDRSSTYRPYGLSAESFKQVHQMGIEAFVVDYLDLADDLRPAENPMAQPKPTAMSQTAIKKIARFTNIISKHPMWSAIIAGLVVLLLSHFIFGAP